MLVAHRPGVFVPGFPTRGLVTSQLLNGQGSFLSADSFVITLKPLHFSLHHSSAASESRRAFGRALNPLVAIDLLAQPHSPFFETGPLVPLVRFVANRFRFDAVCQTACCQVDGKKLL